MVACTCVKGVCRAPVAACSWYVASPCGATVPQAIAVIHNEQDEAQCLNRVSRFHFPVTRRLTTARQDTGMGAERS